MWWIDLEPQNSREIDLLPTTFTSRNTGSSDQHPPYPSLSTKQAKTSMEISFKDDCYSFSPWKPAMGPVFDKTYALDTETTLIDKEHPWITPAFVLGAVFDGNKGYFLQRKDVAVFFRSHENVSFVCHNAPFDLAVLQLVAPEINVYDRVEQNNVWDTQLLHQLYVLGMEGHTARGHGQATLEHCVEQYLGALWPRKLRTLPARMSGFPGASGSTKRLRRSTKLIWSI